MLCLRRRLDNRRTLVEDQPHTGTPAPGDNSAGAGRAPNGLALNDQQAVALQTVDLYSAGDADDGGLIFAGGEVPGLLGGSGAGPMGPVADEESGIEDLEQEGGQGQVSLVRGESPP